MLITLHKWLNQIRLVTPIVAVVFAAFNTAAHADHDQLRPGKADYSHYPHGGATVVAAAFGPDGRLWRAVPEKSFIYVDYSADQGKTFSAPVRVNPEKQRIKANGENRPDIAVDRAGTIYITFTAEGEQPLVQHFSTSSDGGRSFSAPAPISDQAAEANSSHGKILLDGSGKAYIFWLDERDRTDWRKPENAIYFAVIDGQGRASNSRKVAGGLCECCRFAASLDNEDSPILLARFIYPEDIRDHGLIKIQAGERALPSLRATFDQWEIKGCPEHGPAISIGSNNRYHIAWFTQGRIRQGLFYAYSINEGRDFSDPVPFGTPGRLPSHPAVLARGNDVVLAWAELDGNSSYLMVMQSVDGGRTWQAPETIDESNSGTDYPSLLTSNDNVFVSWNSKKQGYRLVRIPRATGAPVAK